MRCASLPSGSSVRLGHNFFEEENIFDETKARLLVLPIVLTFLITNMALLAILTPGGASTHSPTVLWPSWPNLEPAVGFKAYLAQRSTARLILHR